MIVSIIWRQNMIKIYRKTATIKAEQFDYEK